MAVVDGMAEGRVPGAPGRPCLGLLGVAVTDGSTGAITGPPLAAGGFAVDGGAAALVLVADGSATTPAACAVWVPRWRNRMNPEAAMAPMTIALKPTKSGAREGFAF